MHLSNQALVDEELKEARARGGEGQDRFYRKRRADGRQRVGQCPVNPSLPPARIWSGAAPSLHCECFLTLGLFIPRPTLSTDDRSHRLELGWTGDAAHPNLYGFVKAP